MLPTGRPRFRRHLRAEIGESEVFLFDEAGVTTLRSAAAVAVAGMLDGRHDVASIVAARPGGLSAEQVSALIGQLVAAGLITVEPVAPTRSGPELAWWDACGIEAEDFQRPGTVGLTVLGRCADEAVFVSALEAAGVEVVPLVYPEVAAGPAAEPQLDVVICDDYLDPCLSHVDAAHRAAGRPWLLARPGGVRAWIGPVFAMSGSTGCWHCLTHRLWAHRGAEAVVQAVLGRRGPAPRPAMSVPMVTTAVAHLVALEASKWLAGYHYAGQRGVWLFDTQDLSGERHELRARPQCPACGDPGMVAARALRPVRLRHAPRTSSGGGGDRTVAPADMLARFRHLISPVTGITKRVIPDPFAPAFSNAFRSGANLSRRIDGMAALRSSMRAENGGKGFTAIDAEVGALCEAAERFSGMWQGDEYHVRARFSDLGERAIDPRACLMFDERQFGGRLDWNPRHSPFNHVPERIDPDAEIDWTPVWSLSAEHYRMLPTAMLYFSAPRVPFCYADSNGCAAGSSIEDAVLQGLLELVERDAVAQWWYNRLPAPEVDLGAFADPRFAEQRANHAGIGRRLWVLDVTSDLGVPVMAAVSRRTDPDGERILLGFGAHLDPAIALRRAVSEVNQMLSADRDDPSRSDDPDWRHWGGHATLANQPYLRPDRSCPARVPADYTYPRRADIAEDVEALVDVLAQRGMETFVLDQTRPDVGIPVVRVVVPGMRTFWSRYGPGRLFDVPVELGKLSRPTAYHELNPIPLFL